jgi:hypothetical protein
MWSRGQSPSATSTTVATPSAIPPSVTPPFPPVPAAAPECWEGGAIGTPSPLPKSWNPELRSERSR